METRPDLAVQKTLTPEIEAQERKAKHGDKPGSHAHHHIVPQEQWQVQQALETIRYSPEVRAARVEALRAQIEAGTYQIDSVSLAMKLLGITEPDAS